MNLNVVGLLILWLFNKYVQSATFSETLSISDENSTKSLIYKKETRNLDNLPFHYSTNHNKRFNKRSVNAPDLIKFELSDAKEPDEATREFIRHQKELKQNMTTGFTTTIRSPPTNIPSRFSTTEIVTIIGNRTKFRREQRTLDDLHTHESRSIKIFKPYEFALKSKKRQNNIQKIPNDAQKLIGMMLQNKNRGGITDESKYYFGDKLNKFQTSTVANNFKQYSHQPRSEFQPNKLKTLLAVPTISTTPSSHKNLLHLSAPTPSASSKHQQYVTAYVHVPVKEIKSALIPSHLETSSSVQIMPAYMVSSSPIPPHVQPISSFRKPIHLMSGSSMNTGMPEFHYVIKEVPASSLNTPQVLSHPYSPGPTPTEHALNQNYAYTNGKYEFPSVGLSQEVSEYSKSKDEDAQYPQQLQLHRYESKQPHHHHHRQQQQHHHSQQHQENQEQQHHQHQHYIYVDPEQQVIKDDNGGFPDNSAGDVKIGDDEEQQQQQDLTNGNHLKELEQKPFPIVDDSDYNALSSLIGKSPSDQIQGLTYLLEKEIPEEGGVNQQYEQQYQENHERGGNEQIEGLGKYQKQSYLQFTLPKMQKKPTRPQDNRAPILFPQKSDPESSTSSAVVSPSSSENPDKTKYNEIDLHEYIKSSTSSSSGQINNNLHLNINHNHNVKDYKPVTEPPERDYYEHSLPAVVHIPAKLTTYKNLHYAAGISPNYEDFTQDVHHKKGLRYASRYAFGYRVRDFHTGNDFGHKQNRDIDGVTRGQYHILLPDGRVQNVIYHADESGFHADVKYETGH